MNQSGLDLTVHSYLDKKKKKATFNNFLFTSKENINYKRKLNKSLTMTKEYCDVKNYVRLFQKPKLDEGLRLMQSYMRIKQRKKNLLNYSTENNNFSTLNPDNVSINAVPIKETNKKESISNIRFKKRRDKKENNSLIIMIMETHAKMRTNSNKKIVQDHQIHNNNNKYPSQSPLPKVNRHHQKSRSSYDSQLYQLSEMKENKKSNTKSKKVSQCFKNLNYTHLDSYDIVYNDEKEKIIFNEKPNLVKTSLIKVYQKRANIQNQTLNKDTFSNKTFKLETSNFTELLKQEKENANKHYLKKKELMLKSYEKQKKNNIHKHKVIDFLSLNHIKTKNNNNMKLLQNEMRKKMSCNVIRANHEIKGFKNTIIYILHNNLAEVKSELNHLG